MVYWPALIEKFGSSGNVAAPRVATFALRSDRAGSEAFSHEIRLTALLLGVVGIYGVISYMVAQRTREVGVRVALGARQVDITRRFVRHGIALASVGIGCAGRRRCPDAVHDHAALRDQSTRCHDVCGCLGGTVAGCRPGQLCACAQGDVGRPDRGASRLELPEKL
jgi:hypothetical protein